MNKEILDAITRNNLPVVRENKKQAATALLDEQIPYELFESAAGQDPCICINLYRSIGENRPDKETEHITLATLANIYGVHVLRNKLNKFSELAKTSLSEEDKEYCTKIYVLSLHLSQQVLALSKIIGDKYPKQMAVAALMFNSGELQYASSRLDKKNYNLSLKERMQLNHQVALKFNLPLLAKQSTGTAFSGNYQSEIIYWSYRYILAVEELDSKVEQQACHRIAEILCVSDESAHKHLIQIALNFVRDNPQFNIFSTARYILYQRYDNKITQGSHMNDKSEHTSVEADENMSPAKLFIDWLMRSQKNDIFTTKQDAVKAICAEIDKVKPTDACLLIRYCRETRESKVIWASSKNQLNLQELLSRSDQKDALIDIVARKDKTVNIIPETVTEPNIKALYSKSFVNKLNANQLVLTPIYEDYFDSTGGHFIYLFMFAAINEILDKQQMNALRMVRHFFRRAYADASVPAAILQNNQNNVVQLSKN